jgi:regulatory protein
MFSSGSSHSPDSNFLEKAFQKMKHFCGYQERSPAEARQKLYSLGLYKKDVETLITRLADEHHLNEERFALLFASGKSRIRGWGKQKIRQELRLKGVQTICIDQALCALDESEYAAGFERLARKKWDLLRTEKNIFVRKNKWQQFLLQRGFEPSMIRSWSFPAENKASAAEK